MHKFNILSILKVNIILLPSESVIMSTFCKYKDALGKPGEGVHSYRIFNIAIVDVVATIVVAALVSHFLDYGFLPTLVFMFVLGIILHSIFCVKTTINTWLFPQ